MGWLNKIVGYVSNRGAEVDTNNQLQVTPSQSLGTGVGFTALAGRNDDGTVVSGGRVLRAYVSEGQGLKQAIPCLLWDDTLNSTAQNTAKYKFGATTQTGAMAGGFLILNNSSITTANTNSGVQTWRSFPLFAKAELRCNISCLFTQAPQANETYEWGLFQAALPGGTAPTDGTFWRRNTSGELRGVINYNGTETQSAAITPPSANVNHDYVIVCQTDTVCFYIDDILQAVLTLQSAAPTQGQPMMSGAVPLTVRYYIGASTPALASQIKVSDVFVTSLGPDLQRTWSEVKAGFGHMGSQGQNGGTMGSTGNYSNAAVAAAAALSNTAASTGSPAGLGGVAHVLPTLTVGTDGILFSFQNPAGGATQTPRNLVIRGVMLRGVVDVALTGGPVCYIYSLAYGHSAISLATAESGSFASGTTKTPRRVAIGVEGYVATAAAGTVGQGIYYQFASPIVIAPNEFVAVTARNMGVVTSAGSLVITCAIDSYWE